MQRTAENCFIPLTVGGGVRTLNDIQKLLHAGADKISINTAAVLDRDLIRQSATKFGSSTIVIAVDAKKQSNGEWNVFTHGGREKTELNVIEYCKEAEK